LNLKILLIILNVKNVKALIAMNTTKINRNVFAFVLNVVVKHKPIRTKE